jgi:hypothetical protein
VQANDSLIVRLQCSAQLLVLAPKATDKGLDEVSTAIHGGAAAMNMMITGLTGDHHLVE